MVEAKLPSSVHVTSGGRQSHRARWRVRCDCGLTFEMTGTFMRRRGPRGCKACAYRERPQSTRRQSDEERLFRLVVVNRAGPRGITVAMTVAEFMSVAARPCAYCGALPGLRRTSAAVHHAAPHPGVVAHGIDRVDSSKGYEVSNCVPCCKRCNFMKSDTPVGEFIAHVHRIAAHRPL